MALSKEALDLLQVSLSAKTGEGIKAGEGMKAYVSAHAKGQNSYAVEFWVGVLRAHGEVAVFSAGIAEVAKR